MKTEKHLLLLLKKNSDSLMGGYFILRSTVFPHLKKQTGSQPNYFLVELLYFLHICKDKERLGAFLNEKE